MGELQGVFGKLQTRSFTATRPAGKADPGGVGG
jgi:hypothetical protein